MGFGSYDESEQQNQDVDTDSEPEGVEIHEHDHDGEVTFAIEASTDDLLDKFEDIKHSDEG